MDHTQHHHHHDTHHEHQAHETGAMPMSPHDHMEMGHAGHDKHAGHNPTMFRQKFWVSLLLTLPIVYLSHTVAGFLGYQPVVFTGSEWVTPLLGTVLFLYGGLVFIKSARVELADRAPGMMTLISLAIIVAFGYSWAVSLGLPGMDFWWELATLITIMLLGHWLEMKSIMQAQGALGELAKLLPDTAERVTCHDTETIPVHELRLDDEVLVRPGASVPADGVVVKGDSSVDEAMVTGESKAAHKHAGAEVVGGTINGDGALTVRVTKLGDSTVLAGIMKLVADAQASKSRTQVLADRFAGYLFYIALGVALLTALGWSLFSAQPASFIIERVVTVLITACPHALGLAVPLVTAISTSLAARNGLLVRKRQALEAAKDIEVVLFDKTGTLTEGKQGVTQVFGDEKEVLALAASLEQQSEHSIGRAIVSYAQKHTVPHLPVDDFFTIKGKGVRGTIDSETVLVGSPSLLADNNVKITTQHRYEADGETLLYVAKGSRVVGGIALSDVIRPESREAVQRLQRASVEVAIVTGDNESVARAVAGELGIDTYYAGVLPDKKADVVKQLQASGKKVVMVGDGINDAPALARADVGIAIGAGTDIAIESAGIILSSSDPRSVAKVIALSRATYRKMQQNLVWGAGYNIVTIPLAAGVIPGVMLSPAVGAVIMSLSTIIVALNAQLLRRVKL